MQAVQTTLLKVEDVEYKLNTSPEIVFTKPFKEATVSEYREKLTVMLLESLKEFKELNPRTIKIGATYSARALAAVHVYSSPEDMIGISINPTGGIRYRVLGHELMHFVQRLGLAPSGEKACDIYSMARSPLFLDIPPNYLQLPDWVTKNWNRYAHVVRRICIMAIERRETTRQYIKWCEEEIENGIVG